MAPLVSSIALTKLHTPPARTGVIPRARLVDLPASQTANFFLVCAPAGYGKTTLLAAWAQGFAAGGAAVAWCGLDADDDDPLSFGSTFVASLIQALGSLPELTQIAQLLRSSTEIDLRRYLPAVINAVLLSGRQCVLLLDDYHLIGSPAIHRGLAYLLDRQPENLRIVIGSRSEPPLPLARLRARGQILEVRPPSLRFTSAETARFLNESMQLGLTPDGVAALEKRTEGWIAGLQLAALSLTAHVDKDQAIASLTGSQRYLAEYLLEEVFAQQAESVQAFLLATAVLERMCGSLCDALWHGEIPGAEVLKRLEQANLFVFALDDQAIWYRYHHLFGEFLKARANKVHPERISQLHRAACEWLAERNLLREAARHAFQTGDWDYAAAFVDRHNFSLIVHSEIATLYEWCSAFPEHVMQRQPLLCILQALALAYGFRHQNRSRVEARLHQATRLIGALEDRQAARELNELAIVVHTFMAFAPDLKAEPTDLFGLAHTMMQPYPPGDAGQFSGLLLTGYAHLARHDAQAANLAFEEARQIALREQLYFGIVESTFHLARLAHTRGLLRRSAAICRQGQADIAAVMEYPEQALPALGSLDVALGCVLLEQDRLDEAEERLQQGLSLMGGGMNPYYLMTGYLALFRLYALRGQTAEALKSLDRLEVTWPDVSFCTRGLRAANRLACTPESRLAQEAAATWCEEFKALVGEADPAPGMGPFGAGEVFYVAYFTWAQIQVTLGNPQPAIACLQKQLDQAAANGLQQRVIELSVLLALAQRGAGDTVGAQNTLLQALSAAQPEGYVRVFDRGPLLVQMLIEVAQQPGYTAYCKQLLTAIGAGSSPQGGPYGAYPNAVLYEQLSEREMEVLRLIAAGATNRDIAERLVITVGTVKSHINHILGKLEARNRTEAVARARALGLLEP